MKIPSLLIKPCIGMLFFSGVVASGTTAPPGSPEEMAVAVRQLVTSGAGALMPNLDEAYIEDGGLVPLGEGDFPAMFLHGLVAEWRDGAAVFPVEVRLDDDTGDAYFLDALGEPFWYVPSNVPEHYRPWLVANPWFAPSRAGIRWTFVHDADAALLRAASAPAARHPAPLRTLPPPPVTDLCFTDFSYTGTSVWFTAAWPASALPIPGGALDVYAKTNLLDAGWFPLAELPVAPAATNAALEIAGADIPGFFVSPHVHDETCPTVTNVTFDLVSNEPVTGIVYRCYRYRAVSSGFLRLGTRKDTDGDGLPDAYETLVLDSDPFDSLDAYADPDGDGLPNIYEFVYGTNPRVPDWGDAPISLVGGANARYATLADAFRNCSPYEILVVSPGIHSGPSWTDLEFPDCPVLLTSSEGGKRRGTVLKAGEELSVFRIADGAGRHVVVQGLSIELSSSAPWQAAFLWGGLFPLSGMGAEGCFRNIDVQFGAGSGAAIGWQFRHSRTTPILLTGCVVNAEGRDDARGIYSIDSPPLYLENCSFREFPDANVHIGYALQTESTSANLGSAPAEVPVLLRNCLFDASFTNALALAPLTNGVRYAVAMENCLLPSVPEYPPETSSGTVLAPVSIESRGHLPSGSVAIGGGTAPRLTFVDIDGETWASPPDIGADEWSDGSGFDSDGDRLSNGAEIHVYGTDPFSPDTDGDGVGDGTEVSEGTDPLDRGSACFVLSGRLDANLAGTNRVVLAIASTNSGTLRLLASVSPSAPPSFSFSFPHVTLTNEPSPSLCLFVDVDEDGWPGTNESRQIVSLPLAGHETVWNPVFREVSDDADADGIPDLWEQDHGLSPTNAIDACADPDGDGLINLHEYWHDYDPWFSDGSNTVLSVLSRSIDDRIAGKNPTNSLKYFSRYPGNVAAGATNALIANASCWAADIDFSCESPWNTNGRNTKSGTLISHSHILLASHHIKNSLPLGTKFWFRSHTGEIYTRFLTATNRIVSDPDTDWVVGLLNEPLPESIKIAKILPPDFYDYIGSGKRVPCASLDQEGKILVADINTLPPLPSGNSGGPVQNSASQPVLEQRSAFFEILVSGDSSNPKFLLFGDQPILVSIHWNRYHSGTSIRHSASLLESAMEELSPSGDWHLSCFDFSGFSKIGGVE